VGGPGRLGSLPPEMTDAEVEPVARRLARPTPASLTLVKTSHDPGAISVVTPK